MSWRAAAFAVVAVAGCGKSGAKKDEAPPPAKSDEVAVPPPAMADAAAPAPVDAAPAVALATIAVDRFEAVIDVPPGVKVEPPDEPEPRYVHLTDGTIHLTIWVIDELSKPDAKAMKASLMKEDGFGAFTVDTVESPQVFEYQYTLADGNAGVNIRKLVHGKPVTCSTHDLPPPVIAAVVAACHSLRDAP